MTLKHSEFKSGQAVFQMVFHGKNLANIVFFISIGHSIISDYPGAYEQAALQSADHWQEHGWRAMRSQATDLTPYSI